MKKLKKQEASGQFMMSMAVFVVLLSGILVLLLGMGSGRNQEVVLGGSTDVVVEAEQNLRGVGDVDISADLDRLDQDISGL